MRSPFSRRLVAVAAVGLPVRVLYVLVLMAVHRGPPRWPFVGAGVVVTLQTLLTYGAQRWRATAEPVIVTCAAMTIVALVRSRRRRRWHSRRLQRVWSRRAQR